MSEKEREQLTGRVKAAMERHGHNTRDVAHLLNLGKAPVERFVNGERAGEQVQAAMREYLARGERGDYQPSGRGAEVVVINEQPRRALVRERPRQHYETVFIRQIGSLIDLARENCSIVIGLAEFGAGKTYAAQVWRSKHRDVPSLLYEFDPWTSAYHLAFLGELAGRVVGRSEDVTVHNSYHIWKDLITELAAHPRVLVFDQCEAVRVRLLQAIRHIWDMTGCPIVLLAAPSLKQRLDRGRAGDLGALRSRISCWDELSGLTVEDTAAVLKREGVGDLDAETVALLHEAVGGSMRYLLEAIDLIASRHKGKKVGVKTVVSVCRRLMGIRARVEARAALAAPGVIAAAARSGESPAGGA